MWVDRFTGFEPGRWAEAVKNVTLAESHIHDVAPWYPSLPRTLIIEGLAQTGGVLVGYAGGYKENVILAKIARAAFHADALPGQQLVYRAEMMDYQPEGARVVAKATADGQRLAEIDLIYVHLGRGQALPPGAGPSFVFDGIFDGLVRLNPIIALPGTEPGEEAHGRE
jgi:3-hydroxyacyl-[acyl-carrier-protein] dehydratase